MESGPRSKGTFGGRHGGLDTRAESGPETICAQWEVIPKGKSMAQSEQATLEELEGARYPVPG